MATAETAFRRTINTAFHQVVAFGTLSLVGSVVSLPVVTAGPAVIGVAYGVTIIFRRGAQHGVRETFGIFKTGFARHMVEGILLSLALVVLMGSTWSNLMILFGGPAPLTGAVLILSLALLAACTLVVMHAVSLIACGVGLTPAVRDGTVLLVRRPIATLSQAGVIASLLVLGLLTMFGWALIGFAVAAAFSVAATDRVYVDLGHGSPLYP